MPAVGHTRHKNGKTYANIAGVIGLPDGIPAPKVQGETLYFDDVKADTSNLPKWMQEAINPDVPAPDSPPVPKHEQATTHPDVMPASMRGSEGVPPDYNESAQTADKFDDDIPF